MHGIGKIGIFCEEIERAFKDLKKGEKRLWKKWKKE